uniref:Ulp1 protease-like n=1 Tax=Oryza sativa subsp. japonica TaxID=39947 RepID=Q5Z8R7_ORYSJ|nr:Ulp1 protease-like [Oryza sativa Japonica Group]BAD53837.1 Ulp1 protease-like [Oryza sativa Japonica Group]
MGINTSPPRKTGDRQPPWKTPDDMRRSTRSTQTTTMEDTHDNQHTPTRSHNIQAYIRQDTPSDIDFRDRHGYSPTVSPDTVRRYESAISDLAGHGFEEEGYPVVDYESYLQTAMSTTVR